MATHGSLEWSSQPRKVQDVTFDNEALMEFEERMHALDEAVAVLREELEKIENN